MVATSAGRLTQAENMRVRKETPCESWRYIRIMSILKNLPYAPTAEYLAKKTESQMTNMRLILRAMRFSKLICIKEWKRNNRAWVPCYGLGSVDVEPPESAKHLNTDKVKPRARVIAFASLIDGLKLPIMAKELAEDCGLSHGYVHRFIKVAHLHGLIRICGWTRDAGCGNWTPVWQVRTTVSWRDAKRPDPISAKEKQRRHIAAQAIKRKVKRLERGLMAMHTRSEYAEHGNETTNGDRCDSIGA